MIVVRLAWCGEKKLEEFNVFVLRSTQKSADIRNILQQNKLCGELMHKFAVFFVMTFIASRHYIILEKKTISQ